MTIRTRLPIFAAAVTGIALAGCVQPVTRTGRIDLAPPKAVVTAFPNVQPGPAFPQTQLPAPGVTTGNAEREWLPGVDLSKIRIRPIGPQADPYLQHYPPVLPAPETLWLPGTDLRAIRIAPLGPEADPTLQHKSAAALPEDHWLPGVDLRLIDLTVPGPEADPYLQHVP